ncbi:GIY-YIG nuclease family protein [Nocardioides marinquilinus]
MPFTYILECSDGSYYVGSTWDLDRRLAQHHNGEGPTYVRRRRPFRLAWCHQSSSIRQCFELEQQIKGWRREKREALMEGRFEDLPELARSVVDGQDDVAEMDDGESHPGRPTAPHGP